MNILKGRIHVWMTSSLLLQNQMYNIKQAWYTQDLAYFLKYKLQCIKRIIIPDVFCKIVGVIVNEEMILCLITVYVYKYVETKITNALMCQACRHHETVECLTQETVYFYYLITNEVSTTHQCTNKLISRRKSLKMSEHFINQPKVQETLLQNNRFPALLL